MAESLKIMSSFPVSHASILLNMEPQEAMPAGGADMGGGGGGGRLKLGDRIIGRRTEKAGLALWGQYPRNVGTEEITNLKI